ncbi:OLC1v1015800C1 [Oldenlandia corymbosa var. corymbosa]|uniref:OLC1v1015800C1 n=1 Tax=Oldenlandia corymbosa var. corymbosa TaxID=529605 RepID=A0AAV1E4A7_OLDCO|nr:OLC1v1015800C1 [Oldenlandia corymbosa var. corymbosa]
MNPAVDGEIRHDFVIVGAGIGGLAAALALHRKGFKDVVVYERSESLRSEGTGIMIYANGWRALDQLGVGPQLRDKAFLLQGPGEARCLVRRDLINALADSLPPNTIQFGCNLVDVKMDTQSMSPILRFDDDKVVRAKVLIGCEGLNSRVSDYIGLQPPSSFAVGVIRGMTNYPDGSVSPWYTRRRNQREGTVVGGVPINNKLAKFPADGKKFPNDPQPLKQAILKIIEGYPADSIEMVEKGELDTISLSRVRYRHPWEILTGKFRRGSVTVIGDAMHVMGPFMGQGGSAALEDAVILARNLGNKISPLDDQIEDGKQIMRRETIEEAIDGYIKERRMRIVRISTQNYLIGLTLDPTTSTVAKFIAIIMMITLFGDGSEYSRFDCGKLRG